MDLFGKRKYFPNEEEMNQLFRHSNVMKCSDMFQHPVSKFRLFFKNISLKRFKLFRCNK